MSTLAHMIKRRRESKDLSRRETSHSEHNERGERKRGREREREERRERERPWLAYLYELVNCCCC